MKKILFIVILFLAPFYSFSQNKKSIDSFIDIPFGSDSATVKAMIAAKNGVKNDAISRKDYIIFTGLSIGGHRTAMLGVKFVNNKAYEAGFMFSDFKEDDILTYYDTFCTDITAVYGKGTMTNNFGNSNNMLRILKLKSGNATCSTVWESKNKNTISLTFRPIDQSLYVLLLYQDGVLWDLNAAERRSDF
ncbi:MAG: hypothetical protein ACHQHN_16755 [Sphingobacteriales bacterium]